MSHLNIKDKFSKISFTFPDGSISSFNKGVTGFDIAKSISDGLARNAVIISVDDVFFDLSAPLEKGGSFKIFTVKDKESLHFLWHSTAHVLAEAVHNLFPSSFNTIGPAIESGFYYDFDVEKPFSSEDLELIEKEMLRILKSPVSFSKEVLSKERARQLFNGNKYKLELINDIEGKSVSIYRSGDFVDLCSGPHISSTSLIKSVKLLKSSSAYWKADEKNKMLQRIYGISFFKKSDLDDWIVLREEVEKRNHIKIGKEQGLFLSSPLVGPGLMLLSPKGAIIRQELEAFMRNLQVSQGYQFVYSPHLAKVDLFKVSGHYPYYKDSQFPPIKYENDEYLVKPMNCPFHILIYSSKQRSYKELPLKFAEFGTVYRHEQSGELNGLLRVRGLTQDDAHIFCTPEQVEEEFKKVLDMVTYVFNILGFSNYSVRFSTHDPENISKYVGDKKVWGIAETAIENVLKKSNFSYVVGKGEAAFYGPKTDFIVKDILGREWQLGTVQLDYNLPVRFKMSYVGEDNAEHVPVMIHRAPFGSFERFMGFLIEHFAGKFPVWLSPVQVKLILVSEKSEDFAKSVFSELQASFIRAEFDDRNETVSYKIRQAELEKVPFIVVIGEKEKQANSLNVRFRDGSQKSFSVSEFKKFILDKISLKSLD